ncbi:MAG: phage major capsid protein [Pseudomonadota bacterium]
MKTVKHLPLMAHAALVVVAVAAAIAGLFDVSSGVALATAALAVPADRIQAIKDRLVELAETVRVVQARADAEQRALTPDEATAIDNATNDFEALETELRQRERTAQMQARAALGGGRKTEPTQPAAGNGGAQPQNGLQHTVLRTQSERDRWGFQNLAAFANAVKDFQLGSRQDVRLIENAALSTYGSEGVGADGGFAVPPQFRAEIQSLVQGEDTILSRCDAMPTDSNMVIVPTDEDTAWGNSGGVRVYRRAEAGTGTQSKPALKDVMVRVEEMYALVPLTDQLASDAPMLSRWLTRKAGEKMTFKINDEIVSGTGAAGQMLGILNSPALVTVSKESSQGSGTIVGLNILKMYSRMPDAVRRNAVWLINQDIEPQLLTINNTFKNDVGSAAIAAGVSGLIPEGGLRFDPTNGTLMGRPIISTEACSSIGTTGDIILAYLSGYFAPYKAGGVQEAMSMHLWFDQGMTAFRWTFRIGGQPWLSAPISRRNGSNTLSHFVALETR